MNLEIANSLSGYIELLYIINQKLIKLCGADAIDKYEYSHKEILYIIQNLPRLIPYQYNKGKKKLELTNNNGLLEYNSNIDYLKDIYVEILERNYDFLDDIRIIRNKYEHKMHDIKRKSSGSGSISYFDFTFEVSSKEITLEAKDFIILIKKLNSLFSLIINDIKKYAYENGKYDYPYYRRLSRFDFEDFNIIYDSKLLRTIGTIMLDY